MKPSQYLAPWIYAPTTRQAAQQQLLRELEQLGAELTESDQQEGLFQARISYFTAGERKSCADLICTQLAFSGPSS